MSLKLENYKSGDTIRENLMTSDIITRNISQVPKVEMDLPEHGEQVLELMLFSVAEEQSLKNCCK